MIQILFFIFFLGSFQDIKSAELGLQGNWALRHNQYERIHEKRLGCDVVLPLHRYVEASLGYQVSKVHHDYNDLYKEELSKYGLDVRDLEIEAREQTSSALANLFLVYPLSQMRFHVFGGVVSRYICVENTFFNSGCSQEKLAWNTGFGVGMKISQLISLKLNYNLTPSIKSHLDSESKVKSHEKFDQYITAGLSWIM
jgi:hypothetical protein